MLRENHRILMYTLTNTTVILNETDEVRLDSVSPAISETLKYIQGDVPKNDRYAESG